jgi:prolycopene isomerase
MLRLMARPFPTLRDRPREAYDAVVIGAGVGGLATAALLARGGVRVLLVEQHYMVGGYCSTFRRNGYVFDAATHFYPLLGNPQTISGRLLKQLGVSTRWIKMDPVDHFHLPDGTRFTVPADFDTYRAQLDAMFPHESAALREFFSLVRTAYLQGLLRHFRWRQTVPESASADLTVRDVLDRMFRDERLKLLLTADCPHWGSPPCRTSFEFDSMLRLSYFLGNYYPQGGSQAFADALASCVTAHGGDILMSTRVDRISVERGVTRGVELLAPPARNPRRIRVRAPVVVSNADLLQTMERMLGPDQVGAAAIKRLRRLRPTFPCYLMHIGLRDMPTELLREHQGYYWDRWDPDQDFRAHAVRASDGAAERSCGDRAEGTAARLCVDLELARPQAAGGPFYCDALGTHDARYQRSHGRAAERHSIDALSIHAELSGRHARLGDVARSTRCCPP